MMRFQSAKPALIRATGQVLTSAMADAGKNVVFVRNPSANRPLPYGVLGDITETDNFSSKTGFGSEMVQLIRIYASSWSEADSLAALAIAALVRRDEVAIEDPFYVAMRPTLQMNQTVPDRDERGDTYGAAIQIRWRIGQYQEA